METLELIDKYIDNQLVPTQVKQLEKELQENADLQRLLDSVVISRRAIRHRALSVKVKGLHEHYINEIRTQSYQDNVRKLPVRRDYSWASRIAASVLLSMFGYGAYQYADLDTTRVYQDKFLSYQLPTTRGSADQLSDLSALYSSGNYEAVISQYKALPTKTPSDHFLAGIACLQQQQYSQAIHIFMALQATNQQEGTLYFGQETDYYLALAHLGAGNANTAYSLFKAIHDEPRHLFNESVTELDLLKLHVLRLKEGFISGN